MPITFNRYHTIFWRKTDLFNVSTLTLEHSDVILARINMFNRNTSTKNEICSQLTIMTTRRHSLTSFCCLYCQLEAHFTPYSIFIANFEQENVGWDCAYFDLSKVSWIFLNKFQVIALKLILNILLLGTGYIWMKSIYLTPLATHGKSIDWFLYERDLRHERVKVLTLKYPLRFYISQKEIS